MRKLKKILIRVVCGLLLLHVFLLIVFFIFQERVIFWPTKLDENYVFRYEEPFEEINIKAKDGILLNGLLFKTEEPKGLIFFLHGNAGALNTWGSEARFYTEIGYDVFILDYRGFGKSGGAISSEDQLLDDVQTAYNMMKARYNEIVVLGFSIGTGPAAYLASQNNPQMLILLAPYYSLNDMIRHMVPFLPSSAIRYKLKTNEYIKDCKMPIAIFHGDNDNVIYYESSEKLSNIIKPTDTFVPLYSEGHYVLNNNVYKEKIKGLLSAD